MLSVAESKIQELIVNKFKMCHVLTLSRSHALESAGELVFFISKT